MYFFYGTGCKVPWVAEVFSCAQCDQFSVEGLIRNKGLTETGNCARKVSGTQGSCKAPLFMIELYIFNSRLTCKSTVYLF